LTIFIHEEEGVPISDLDHPNDLITIKVIITNIEEYVISIGPGAYTTDVKSSTKYGTIGHADRKTYAV